LGSGVSIGIWHLDSNSNSIWIRKKQVYMISVFEGVVEEERMEKGRTF
jgi:hypothetical protein